jgi:hypothetical protein
MFSPVLEPTQRLDTGLLSFPVVKWPERDADHSPLSSAEVKNEWSYTYTPPIRLRCVDKVTLLYFNFIVCKSRVYNMATVRNFEVMSTFHVDIICSEVTLFIN